MPAGILSPMLDRFRAHIAERGFFAPGERVLIGYSGGADSTCLLHLMHLAGIDIIAGHLHHGQRAEGDTELKLCEAFCAELGVPFVSGKADVPEMSRLMKIGPEEAGRNARYEFFRQAAFRLECRWIATAHTRDDHVETVLLNLTRGCGLAGLAGIPEVRGNIVRPLLPFSRDETRGYCEAHGLWTHDDPANIDVNFSRSRVRLLVTPELRAINPSFDESVARLAGLASEEDRYFDAHAVHAVEGSEIPLNGKLRFLTLRSEAAFDRTAWRALHPVVLRRAVRLIVEALGGELDLNQTEAAIQGIRGEAPGSVTTERGTVAIEWKGDRVHIRELQPPEPFRYPLTTPGITESDEFGWRIEVAPGEPERFERDALSVVIDQGRVQGPLHFRSPAEGDSLSPMGFSGSRKVSDLLSEAHLTQSGKRRLPVICDILGVVWVPGVCLADRVKTDATTVRGLRMSFGPLETGAIPPT